MRHPSSRRRRSSHRQCSLSTKRQSISYNRLLHVEVLEDRRMLAVSFIPHTISTAANGAISVFAADVDSDGDLDVLSASNLDNKIAWHENDGAENFSTHIITHRIKG